MVRYDTGSPADKIVFYEIYNSKAQLQARTHPALLTTQKYLLSLWHASDPTTPISLRTPVSYFDRFRIRAPVIVFNALCLITGFAMLGFAGPPVARYIGVFLATGAYVANWAALSAYQANNIVGYVHPGHSLRPDCDRRARC